MTFVYQNYLTLSVQVYIQSKRLEIAVMADTGTKLRKMNKVYYEDLL
jgi:hypothetical protein